eukprot:TRINITY_DN27741_c0_g1_i1.p2 TRINITY_DN27741_c0_g1~~TRINITY_DN27741_c0_g1_i1.p2  ORF type:complete len:159 (-),score=28.24 TRINITY_DN27741_c0_g1_i1:10-486(-)
MWRVRASAALGLGGVGPRAIRALLLALYDTQPQVIEAASQAILRIPLHDGKHGIGLLSSIRSRPLGQRRAIVRSALDLLNVAVLPPYTNSPSHLHQPVTSQPNATHTKLPNNTATLSTELQGVLLCIVQQYPATPFSFHISDSVSGATPPSSTLPWSH